jgi:hypothetical protein
MRSRVGKALCIVTLALAASTAALAGIREDIQADMRAGRWAQADARLEQVLDKHPDNALAHYWLAQVKLREGRHDAARDELAEAKRLDPAQAFASDKAVLARLERELAQAPAARSTVPRDPVPTAAPALTPTRAAPPEPAPPQRAESGHTGLWVVLTLVALGALMVWATRSARRRGDAAEREQLRSLLAEADNDLRDAGKSIDYRAELTPEQKLALSDRVLRAQGDIASHLATLSTRTDLSQTHELLRRVRDIAAEVRGEERPSDAEARRAMEMQRMQPMNSAPVIVQQSGGLGGMGTAGAALGGLAAGAVLGGLLSGSGPAHAREVDAGPRFTPIDEFDGGGGSGLDVGGSGGDWDTADSDLGGSDLGGGGGDFD